jgi:hypothetical protein
MGETMKLYLKIALALLVIGFFWWGFSKTV